MNSLARLGCVGNALYVVWYYTFNANIFRSTWLSGSMSAILVKFTVLTGTLRFFNANIVLFTLNLPFNVV